MKRRGNGASGHDGSNNDNGDVGQAVLCSRLEPGRGFVSSAIVVADHQPRATILRGLCMNGPSLLPEHTVGFVPRI